MEEKPIRLLSAEEFEAKFQEALALHKTWPTRPVRSVPTKEATCERRLGLSGAGQPLPQEGEVLKCALPTR